MNVRLFAWLLRHELRLWWRKTTDGQKFWAWLIIFGLAVSSALFFLWIGLQGVRTELSQTEPPEAGIWVAIALWFIAFVSAFNQAIGKSVVILFERGDLDLLLSSPLSGRAIFAVRLLSVALTVFFGFCIFVVPMSLLAVVMGVPQLLGVYPALIGICLITASLGMLITLWMVRLIGVRRARIWVQILNVVSFLIVFLGFQLPNLAQGSDFEIAPFLQRLQGWVDQSDLLRSLLAVDSWLWFPARAIWFDPVSVGLTLVGSGAIALFTVYAIAQAFLTGTQQSITRKHRARAYEGVALREGFRQVVLAKEWRMMRRNPYLISQVALQVVLILPLTWIVLQNGGDAETNLEVGSIASFALPILSGQLSYGFSQICLSGEEAADLLKSAPVPVGSLRRLKQLAALVPVWLLLLPVTLILMVRGEAWLVVLFASLGASICASYLRLWNSRPVPPKELFRQRNLAQSDFWLGLIESMVTWVWAGLGSALYTSSGILVLAFAGTLAFLLPLGYWRGRQLGNFLHY